MRPLAGGRKVRGGVEVEIEDRTLKLTNLDKVLYPKVGFTKADLIGYYAAWPRCCSPTCTIGR